MGFVRGPETGARGQMTAEQGRGETEAGVAVGAWRQAGARSRQTVWRRNYPPAGRRAAAAAAAGWALWAGGTVPRSAVAKGRSPAAGVVA